MSIKLIFCQKNQYLNMNKDVSSAFRSEKSSNKTSEILSNLGTST